ncbi:unnamed protein product [Cyprideis torosa]|uniref:Uncharacterized protein n=1 Tax=Cyprideis torosa TaxID=163714 RepID=A0A7R8WJC3_9CRUS|nr:unnamed protein product [Cyprideis torosa]CAG0901814.1 unnamed protein product [Cyprideis torosa]
MRQNVLPVFALFIKAVGKSRGPENRGSINFFFLFIRIDESDVIYTRTYTSDVTDFIIVEPVTVVDYTPPINDVFIMSDAVILLLVILLVVLLTGGGYTISRTYEYTWEPRVVGSWTWWVRSWVTRRHPALSSDLSKRMQKYIGALPTIPKSNRV